MDVTLHASLLPRDAPDASLACYRDTLGSPSATAAYPPMPRPRRRPTKGNQTYRSKLGWIEPGAADGDREGGPA